MASDAHSSVFIDANVLFSAALTPSGIPRQLLALSALGLVHLVLSRAVMAEAIRNLQRKAPASLERLGPIFNSAGIRLVENPPQSAVDFWTAKGIAEDAHVVAAAELTASEYLCTGDRRLVARLRG